MKFSKIRSSALIGLAGLLLGGSYTHAQSVSTNRQKVIIYPSAGETIKQLKQQGIDDVESYGSYWVANTDEQHFKTLQATRGKERVVSGAYLNHIELRATGINTSLGEPAVPAGMGQVESSGKHLRLIQFKGPIKRSWLDQVKAAGDLRIMSYVPNSAYVVWLDGAAEQKLASLMVPQGPIQWMGAYHPYYKIPQDLSSVSGDASIKVRVDVVDQSEDPQAARELSALGFVNSKSSRDGQTIFEMDVQPSAIGAIAQLPDVLWIEKVWPMHVLDEVQDLVLADKTNYPSPPFSPTPPVLGGIHYLDWLTNTVGGGMLSFTFPNLYPVVDIADTGLDNGTTEPFHPAFYYGGVPAPGNSRVVNLLPPWLADDPVTQLGCVTRVTDKNGAPFRFLEAADLWGHGTRVASIVAGFDNGTNKLSVPTQVLITITNIVIAPVPGIYDTLGGGCPPANGPVTLTIPSGISDICGTNTFTNTVVTISTNACPTNITLNIAFTSTILTNYSESRQEAGFQKGMGVSPYGLISASRIWDTMSTAAFKIETVNSACVPTFGVSAAFCINDIVSVLASAYVDNFARIQNNSWAEAISTSGDNGGVYDAASQTFDGSVRDVVKSAANAVGPLNQEFIVVFACNSLLGDAGNLGNAGGFADMRVTAPATAKNVISVGASIDPDDCTGESSLNMYERSAAGPTTDQRFKPEIVAPGAGVYAAIDQLGQSLDFGLSGLSSNCSADNIFPFAPAIISAISPSCKTQTLYTQLYTCNNFGSSFAAPAVSGGIQLLWWYFENRLTNEVGRALSQPSPAMAKAYLCNAARYLPITNPQTGARDTLPSIVQGMGEMDLARMFDGVGRVIRDESTPRALDVPLVATNRNPQQTFFSQSGQSYEVSGQIQSSNLPFRVTLAWLDAPGGGSAVLQQLVNDLDLEVTVGGQRYRGNVFSEDHSVPGGGFDGVNNMESVFLPPGQTGPWSIIIRAVNIAGNGVPNVGNGLGQDFALVVYNSLTNISTLTDVPNLATNNSCQTALGITTFPYQFGNNLNSNVYNNTMPSPTAGLGGIDEFFKIESPGPGITFSVDTSASSFNSVLSVWRVQTVPNTLPTSRGECGFLEELISQEIDSTNGGGGVAGSPLSFTSDGSNTYFIVVEPQNNAAGGSMVLTVNATGTGINISPSQLNFGSQISGTTSTPQTVTYQRVNPGSVTINSVTDTDLSDFQILSQSCSGRTLNNGGSCLVTISFTPHSVGLLQANLVISDDGTGSPRIIPLSGLGTPAAPLICLGTPIGGLTFSNTAVGVSSAPQTITLTNCGTAPLSITNVFFRTAASNDFSVAQNCTNAVINPGGTCTLLVTFHPTIAGPRSTILDIFNTSTVDPVEILVTGTGFTPVPAVCVSANTINFGNVDAGGTSSVHSVTITNCGTAPLTISNVTVTGANPGDFINISLPCSTLAVGSNCVIGLQFAPTAGGARSANLVITDNVAGSPQLIALVGSGNLSQPDASIAKNTNVKKLIGRGIINTSGIGQELIQKVRRGARHGVKFYIAVQNVGTASDRFLVQAQQIAGGTGWTATYFLGAKPKDSVDVTAAVESGAFSTSTLAPNAITSDTTMLRVEVTADKINVFKGTTATFTLTFSSAADPTRQDTVRVTVTAR